MTRYCFVRDDSSHWYLCPADKQKEANAYFEATEKYWAMPSDGGYPGDEPAYLTRVNPYCITFENPIDWLHE